MKYIYHRLQKIFGQILGSTCKQKVILFQISNKQANFSQSVDKCSQKSRLEAYKIFCAS